MESPAFITAVEKLARLEMKVETLSEHVKHIDLCVDSLKRTVWFASGATIASIALVNWLLKHA